MSDTKTKLVEYTGPSRICENGSLSGDKRTRCKQAVVWVNKSGNGYCDYHADMLLHLEKMLEKYLEFNYPKTPNGI